MEQFYDIWSTLGKRVRDKGERITLVLSKYLSLIMYVQDCTLVFIGEWQVDKSSSQETLASIWPPSLEKFPGHLQEKVP